MAQGLYIDPAHWGARGFSPGGRQAEPLELYGNAAFRKTRSGETYRRSLARTHSVAKTGSATISTANPAGNPTQR